MAKWIRNGDTDQYFNIDAIAQFTVGKAEEPYLRCWLTTVGGEHFDIRGATARAVAEHLKNQGVDIGLEKYVSPPGKSWVVK